MQLQIYKKILLTANLLLFVANQTDFSIYRFTRLIGVSDAIEFNFALFIVHFIALFFARDLNFLSRHWYFWYQYFICISKQ